MHENGMSHSFFPKDELQKGSGMTLILSLRLWSHVPLHSLGTNFRMRHPGGLLQSATHTVYSHMLAYPYSLDRRNGRPLQAVSLPYLPKVGPQ